MARITDENKLASIKKSLIELIIRDGSTNASIAKVAKKAGVSVGYLYRHYESKEELIRELYVEEFTALIKILTEKIKENNHLKKVVFGFYSEIIEKAKKDENQILFVLKMMTDYSIKISEEMRERLKEIISFLRNKFGKEIDKNIEDEQLYIQISGSVLLFINLRKRGVLKQSEITQKDIELLTQTTINALLVN